MIVDRIVRRTVTVGLVSAAILGFAPASRAQLPPPPVPPPPPPVELSYEASVPISKPVPNPCTGGAVLLTGTLDAAIKVTTGGSEAPVVFAARLTSKGAGVDALSDGTAMLNGSQGPAYEYSSVASIETGFAEVPASHKTTFSLVDFVGRPGSTTDRFRMVAVLELTYLQGVPATPVLRHLDLSCLK
jgi:hypothetical protein